MNTHFMLPIICPSVFFCNSSLGLPPWSQLQRNFAHLSQIPSKISPLLLRQNNSSQSAGMLFLLCTQLTPHHFLVLHVHLSHVLPLTSYFVHKPHMAVTVLPLRLYEQVHTAETPRSGIPGLWHSNHKWHRESYWELSLLKLSLHPDLWWSLLSFSDKRQKGRGTISVYF